jgi:regulator of replication initiation timing
MWGVASVAFVYLVQPVYLRYFVRVPKKARDIMLGAAFAVFIIDLIDTVRKAVDTGRIIERIDRMKETGSTMVEESRRIAGENSRLKQEIRDQQAMMEEQQEDLNRAQAELLNVKSAIAKGDAERVPSDQLTLDAFAAAVRTFIGAVARMPHMRMAFSTMDNNTKEDYSVLLETIEKWASDSRKALETTGAEGTVI